MYSLLRSVPHFSSPCSCSSSFPSCSSRESALVFPDYLRSHFSDSQPKALRSRARGYLAELRQASCLEDSHSFFCSPFFAEFFADATNLSLSAAIAPDKVASSMLNHFPRSGMNFFLHVFNLSVFAFLILPSGRYLLLFPSIRWESVSTFTSFQPMSYTSCLSKLFQSIILSRLLSGI